MNVRNYYMTIARNKGVPEMWLEDAAQMMEIALWKAGVCQECNRPRWRQIVIRTAIDAVRVFGPRSRDHTARECVEIKTAIEIPAADEYDVLVDVLDFLKAWRQLTPTQQQIIADSVEGRSSVSYSRVHEVRQRLRQLAGAVASLDRERA